MGSMEKQARIQAPSYSPAILPSLPGRARAGRIGRSIVLPLKEPEPPGRAVSCWFSEGAPPPHETPLFKPMWVPFSDRRPLTEPPFSRRCPFRNEGRREKGGTSSKGTNTANGGRMVLPQTFLYSQTSTLGLTKCARRLAHLRSNASEEDEDLKLLLTPSSSAVELRLITARESQTRGKNHNKDPQPTVDRNLIPGQGLGMFHCSGLRERMGRTAGHLRVPSRVRKRCRLSRARGRSGVLENEEDCEIYGVARVRVQFHHRRGVARKRAFPTLKARWDCQWSSSKASLHHRAQRASDHPLIQDSLPCSSMLPIPAAKRFPNLLLAPPHSISTRGSADFYLPRPASIFSWGRRIRVTDDQGGGFILSAAPPAGWGITHHGDVQSFQAAVAVDEAAPEPLRTSLFSNFEPLYKFHSSFLRDLEQRVALWEGRSNAHIKGEYQHIGDVMLKNIQGLKPLTANLQRQAEALVDLDQACRASRRLQDVCRDFELQKVCYVPLNVFLLRPLHRLTHYKQILERFCKHYPPTHGDFRDCRDALSLSPTPPKQTGEGRLRTSHKDDRSKP
ncbi:unnamed protein product [Boreogadus saida]